MYIFCIESRKASLFPGLPSCVLMSSFVPQSLDLNLPAYVRLDVDFELQNDKQPPPPPSLLQRKTYSIRSVNWNLTRIRVWASNWFLPFILLLIVFFYIFLYLFFGLWLQFWRYLSRNVFVYFIVSLARAQVRRELGLARLHKCSLLKVLQANHWTNQMRCLFQVAWY